MTFRYLVDYATEPIAGHARYDRGSHAFDFAPPTNEESAALAIADTLQLEFTLLGNRINYLWGYLPVSAWRNEEIIPPVPVPGGVAVDIGDQPQLGITYPEPSVARRFVYDKRNGWFRVGDPHYTHAVEIATDTVLGFSGDPPTLICVWLKPEIV